MDQDFTEWTSGDICEWFGFLHSDFEQYGQRVQFLKIDGEKFEKLKDPVFVRTDLGVKLPSHVNAIVRAVTQRMTKYEELQKQNKGGNQPVGGGNEFKLFADQMKEKNEPKPPKSENKHRLNPNNPNVNPDNENNAINGDDNIDNMFNPEEKQNNNQNYNKQNVNVDSNARFNQYMNRNADLNGNFNLKNKSNGNSNLQNPQQQNNDFDFNFPQISPAHSPNHAAIPPPADDYSIDQFDITQHQQTNLNPGGGEINEGGEGVGVGVNGGHNMNQQNMNIGPGVPQPEIPGSAPGPPPPAFGNYVVCQMIVFFVE